VAQRAPSTKEEAAVAGTSAPNRWTVVLAGTGINLALGVLYAWSIFKAAIQASVAEGGTGGFDWSIASLNDPYALACLVFAFSMILGGRFQDRFGPRVTALLGGLLVGAGFVIVSQTTAYAWWLLGFGALAGAGFGFGYSAATPPALKWFPPVKTGLIAGIVVSGFGLAPVYIAPLSSWLLGAYGIHTSMLILGIGFAALVSLLATRLINPTLPAAGSSAAAEDAADRESAVGPSAIMRTGRFWALWAIYFVGAGAGLMVIGSVAGMAKSALGEMAFLAVAIMAVGNAAGRIVAGIVSDRMGRLRTLALMLTAQAVLMLVAISVVGRGGPVTLVLLATFIGFSYGSNLSIFPAVTKDCWGLKTFGANYGALFTAWGVGGFVMGRASEMITAKTGSFTLSFVLAGALLVVAAGLTLVLHSSKSGIAVPLADSRKTAR
jgi:nitrate/nitrite transporter NarK